VKMITFKEYMNFMFIKHEDYKDINNFYHIVLDVYKSIRRQDKSYYDDIAALLSMTRADRLEYRMQMAEQGKELTPTEVDQLIESMEFARKRAEETL